MLLEGIDDSVIYLFTVATIIVTVIMYNFINGFCRDRLFSVSQINPQVHRESLNDVNTFRDQILTRAEPSAPPHDLNTSQRSNTRNTNRNITCPICLTDSVFPIETNCGHIFCASCIIQYWRHLSSNIFYTKMTCPMCRQGVTCLLPLYSHSEQQRSPDLAEIFTQINTYNRRFSGAPRAYWDYITELPTLLRHAFNELLSFNNLNIWYRIRFCFLLITAFFYFISPLDIIPEAVFGLFGFVDDLLLLLVLAIYVTTIYRQIIANR